MCGICGIINFNQQSVKKASVHEMMQIMKHRGPDDEGVFVEQSVGMGFVRLSIIDLSAAGNQPMFSHDGRHAIVFNGEIYNYIEIREDLRSRDYVFKTNSDTEVLLAAYLEWGQECLTRFNGMWACAIYDRQNGALFCARDRYGVKPFYYFQDNERFLFASEIPPLLQLMAGKPSVNETAVYDYLVFNRTDQGEETFFKGIKKLQHGHSLRIQLEKNGGAKADVGIKKWYDLKSSLKEPFGCPEEFRETFSSAVGLRLRSDVPVGVCLSGGLDSSSIVSILLTDHHKKDLNTFSAIYGKGNTGDESEFIDLFKNKPLNMHFTTPTAQSLHDDLGRFIRAIGEPVPSTAPYAQFKVMELAKGKAVVTLDGQGADEQLAGYHYFYGFYLKELLRAGKPFRFGSELFHYFWQHRSFFGLKTLAYFNLPDRYRRKLREKEKGYFDNDFIERNSSSSNLAENLYGSQSLHDALMDHFEYKLEHLLKWEDRNSMYFSLEARVPFLDYRLVERTLPLPAEKVIHRGVTKYLLRESMKGILPEKIRLRRDKVGFDTPQEAWFKTDIFKGTILSLLESPEFASRHLIDPDKAKEMYMRHLRGEIDIAKEVWKWINLELWYREFVD